MHPMLSPVISIVAGLLILIYPAILNYVIAVYLIIFGILELINRNIG
jgi:uncharacterized membrane protein HdeD (DUF308 family)